MAGTVSEVSGNTITITTRNGQTAKVQLADNGTVRKQVDGQLSDIKQGDQIVAVGTQNGDTFQARLFVSLHSIGRFFSDERPVPSPRHAGQFAVAAAAESASTLTKEIADEPIQSLAS